MEYLDIYDRNGKKTGIVKARGKSLEEGEFIRVVHVCIFNTEGDMLIQKRSGQKKLYGGLWDLSAGGHVMSGESSMDAVMRELREELGIPEPEKESIVFAFTEPFMHVLDDMYILQTNDLKPEDLKIQKEEISCVRWACEEEILKMAEKGTFVDYTPQCLRKLFNAVRIDDERRRYYDK